MAKSLTKPGYREFVATRLDGSKVKLSVRQPHPKELAAADMEMSVTYNKALEGRLPVLQRQMRMLRESGQWTQAEQQKIDDLQAKLGRVEGEVRNNTAKREKLELAKDDDGLKAHLLLEESTNKDRAVLQESLGELRSELDAMIAHTADRRADQAYFHFLLACVVELADSTEPRTRLFGSLDDLLSSQDPLLFQRIQYEFNACQQDLPSAWTAAEEVAAKLEAERKAEENRKAELAAAESKTEETSSGDAIVVQPIADPGILATAGADVLAQV